VDATVTRSKGAVKTGKSGVSPKISGSFF
jgi:hypothetical protein